MRLHLEAELGENVLGKVEDSQDFVGHLMGRRRGAVAGGLGLRVKVFVGHLMGGLGGKLWQEV